MAVTLSIMAVMAVGVAITFIWSPANEIDQEIKDALAYDKNQAKLERAIKGGHSK